MLYLAIAVLAAMAALVLGYALLRKPRTAAARIEHDLEVYRAQLDELSREREAGLVSEAEAASAKLEIERRVLAADQKRSDDATPRGRGREWIPAALVAALVPLTAVGLYAWLGNPQVPSVPFGDQAARQAAASAAQRQAAQESLPDVETMLEQVRARLAQNPDDMRGWTVLARSLVAIGQYDEAIAAFDQALRLSGPNAELYSAKAEAMILAAQGQVSAEARGVLQQALDLEPEHPRANFYLASVQQQDGDLRGALDTLTTLLQGAPAEAAWVPVVRDRAAALATELGLDPAAVLPAPSVAAGGAADPQAAAEQLAARLEANPKDFRGWIALAQARAAMGDSTGARDALDRGAREYAGAPFVLQQFQQAAAELGLNESAGASQTESGTPRGPGQADVEAARDMTPDQQVEMIRGMVDGLAARLKDQPNDVRGWQMLARSYGVLNETEKAAEAYAQVLALAPEDPDALFFLGDAALKKGDKNQAAEYWTRLLPLLEPGSAEHTMVRDQLESLKSAN
jgi:cytochrome c-type biogenesis protein CcmH